LNDFRVRLEDTREKLQENFRKIPSQKPHPGKNRKDAAPRRMQVAPAWLLQRSPNILLIPGTSSVAHLRENLKTASLPLPAHVVAELDSIGADAKRGATV
jgi:aryl-alcohol dehydrogenase-like predicted oxidoreductase